MGGWRCSYRNCSMRTDGKTHMFHYPVFDKVRCHQWLVNAGRLDFLNLKVSQLKNRVICQHHFANEHFMNFKRDKLTFDAVPSLNGPFCDSSDGLKENLEETTNSLAIMFDDIENEYMTLNDKKANYSTKYADFLTSNDLGDIDISTFVQENNIFNKNKDPITNLPEHKNHELKSFFSSDKKVKDQKSIHNYSYKTESKLSISSEDRKSIHNYSYKTETRLSINSTEKHSGSTTTDLNKKYQTQQVQIVPPYKTKTNQSQEETVLEIELPPGFMNTNALLPEENKNTLYLGDNLYQLYANTDDRGNMSTPKVTSKQAKVKILSEKRISEPIAMPTGHLEPVSPSTVLPILQKKPAPPPSLLPTLQKKPMVPQIVSDEVLLNNQELLLDNKNEVILNNHELLENKIPDPVQVATANKSFKKNVMVKESKVYQNNKSKSPRISLLKNKITPERVAEIEEKRKFNMKLRDMIETFLDKLDDDKDSTDVPSQQSKHKGKCLPDQSKSMIIAEQTIASLETRLKKMENALLSKIDQNSQMINDLKKTIIQKEKIHKKSCGTQTAIETQCQKKRLYQEISQYLSADANSLIYEELFINKLVKDVPKASPAKRRRHR